MRASEQVQDDFLDLAPTFDQQASIRIIFNGTDEKKQFLY